MGRGIDGFIYFFRTFQSLQISLPVIGKPNLSAIYSAGESFIPLLPIEYKMFQATVEITRIRSKYRIVRFISAVRMPDLNININVLPILHNWKITEEE